MAEDLEKCFYLQPSSSNLRELMKINNNQENCERKNRHASQNHVPVTSSLKINNK